MTHVTDALPRTLDEKRQVLKSLADRGEVLETPLEALREHHLTPQALAFVRNSNPYPAGTETLSAAPFEGTLDIGGLVARPVTLDFARLAERPYHEVEAVMQCAGNGRAFYRDAHAIEGCAWERGGMLNARWGGVRVADVLEDVGVLPEAGFLTLTGGDRPRSGGEPYEKSVPLSHALAHGLLAWRMNGEPLSGAHGGPLRFVMPGYFGTVNVKWLRRLTLTAEETRHEAQQERYRMEVGGESHPCWAQPLKSVIWRPLGGEVVRGAVTVAGCAFNDGAAPVTRVEVTSDGGRTWHAADLEPGDGPFGWTRWSVTLALPSGEHEVGARATDALGRVQALDADERWNVDGYEFSGMDRVRFVVQE